jgi:hypothetical protein
MDQPHVLQWPFLHSTFLPGERTVNKPVNIILGKQWTSIFDEDIMPLSHWFSDKEQHWLIAEHKGSTLLVWEPINEYKIEFNPVHAIRTQIYLNAKEFCLLEYNAVENQPTFACYLLHTGVLFGLFTYPKDGGGMFLQNTGWISMDYIVLYPRRQNSS